MREDLGLLQQEIEALASVSFDFRLEILHLASGRERVGRRLVLWIITVMTCYGTLNAGTMETRMLPMKTYGIVAGISGFRALLVLRHLAGLFLLRGRFWRAYLAKTGDFW